MKNIKKKIAFTLAIISMLSTGLAEYHIPTSFSSPTIIASAYEETDAPAITSLSSSINKIIAKWSPVKNASNYMFIYKAANEETWSKMMIDGDQTTFSMSDLKSGTLYYISVAALINDGDSEYWTSFSRAEYISTTPASTSIKCQLKSHTSFSIEWNAVDSANGYEVTIKKKGTNWKRTETIKGTGLTSWDFPNLIPNTAYIVSVKAYTKDSFGIMHYGASTSKTIKTYKNRKLKRITTKAIVDKSQVNRTGSFNIAKGVDIVRMINRERVSLGLKKLKWDKTLYKAAKVRAKEISVRYGHTRPDGSSCGTVSTTYHGENIVKGGKSPCLAYESWKNSNGHYQNMIRPTFTRAAVACFCYNGKTYWVTGFGY